ncbi:SDR family oxidoreductase [Haloplasma contractile]|uniref:Retinol dehydrogenase 8 protein n=1 Tax=Haloplasma contractile SSD-17B TaxID=1033810 RepID=U2EDT8_9MOLU|nr:SDR family oxidoreductase [Haloplasma contractile]ERJ13153.1 retinol dehydrogenase 8 protein [Haloplasma contractile SSD-17B]
MDKEIVLITGTSSGFGFMTALHLAEKGYYVIATMRNMNKKELLLSEAKYKRVEKNIEVHKLDVKNHTQILGLKQYIINEFGRLDLLINNAGYCLGGMTEFANTREWEDQLNTNVLSVVAVSKAFIGMMRRNRKGKIINIGSISGRFGFPGMAAYTTSKFALSGFSESLRLELAPFNIKVSLIEAGSFKTNIWEKSLTKVEFNQEQDYEPYMKFIYNSAKQTANTADNPMKVVQLIEKICKSKKPKFRYQIGKGVKTMLLIKLVFPWSLIEWVVIKRMKK